MDTETIKILQIILQRQEKVSESKLIEKQYNDKTFYYFLADELIIYVPIFSENASVDMSFIDFVESLKASSPSNEIKLFFYTRKLKSFAYSYSDYKISLLSRNEN